VVCVCVCVCVCDRERFSKMVIYKLFIILDGVCHFTQITEKKPEEDIALLLIYTLRLTDLSEATLTE
jgi:hypothetical protein